MKDTSFRDRVAERFKAQPHTWISAYTLMQIGGALAFRTRVSGVATSFYRYVPPAAHAQADLFERIA